MKCNKNGTFTLLGMEFDIPNNLLTHDISHWDEGQRIKMTGINLCRYMREGKAIVCWQYTLSISNYGTCYLDDKQLHGEDVETAKALFTELKLL